MTAPGHGAPPRPLSGGSRWLLAVVHGPLLLVPALLAVLLADTARPADVLPTAALAAAVCFLQVRHALAAADGVRPAHWPLTLAALTALVYLPLLWLPHSWIVTQWALVASTVMLLDRRSGLALGALVVVGSEAVLTWLAVQRLQLGPAVAAWAGVYNLCVAALGPVALIVATRLVRVLDDLSAARTELAEAAVHEDRLRISRDLHDVLGQSLAAVSLKGELAQRLWPVDRAAALAEVESLTTVARTALRDIRAVTFDRRPTSVHGELAGAAGLLRAAGIEVSVEVALPGDGTAPRVQDDVLGWALREGVTNVLRHSAATAVAVRAGQRGGRIHLEIVNDGAAGGRGAPGSGLDGLAARARALGGEVTAGALPEGRFRLAVDLPEELP